MALLPTVLSYITLAMVYFRVTGVYMAKRAVVLNKRLMQAGLFVVRLLELSLFHTEQHMTNVLFIYLYCVIHKRDTWKPSFEE